VNSCTRRGTSEVASKGSNLRRTLSKEGPTRIVTTMVQSRNPIWLLWSDLKSAEPARGLPRETRIEPDQMGGDVQRSALLCSWSHPQGGESVPQSPKGLRKRSHASSAGSFHGPEARRASVSHFLTT